MVQNKLISLTPKNKLEENQLVYVEALKFGVEANDVKNIAVTGPYGSGKSTILNVFTYNYKEENNSFKDDILKISITKFQSISRTDSADVEKDLEQDLEQQVLQQMIYTVDPEKIPESRFRRVKPFNIDYYRFFIAKIVLYIFVTFLMFYVFNYGNSLQNLIENKEGDWLVIFTFGVLWIFYTTWLIIYIFEEFRRNIKYFKFGFKGGAIQIDSNTNNNIFDKYLDEIVYYFKVVGYKIVIFEDLDRFNNIEIYERLRNLNFLLNEAIEDRKITFIYALRDDIFDNLGDKDKDKDKIKIHSENPATQRTKFFDLIIPTIKIISHANSEEVFLKYLGLSREKQDNELDLELIQYISYYINDMRLLINIVNEFVIFKQAINNTAINKSKLFAMVVYKNLFPKDYTELLKMNQEGSLLYKALQNQKSLTAELNQQDPYVSTYSYSQLLNVDLNNPKYKEIEQLFINKKTDYQLLWYFLKEGWICEHYTDYISYYYDGVIYQEDLEYLKSVGLNQEVKFNVTLRNPHKVLERLKEDRLSKPYIIINDLLEYLNKNSMNLSDEEQQKRDKIGQYISSNIDLFCSRIEHFEPWLNMEDAVVEGLKLIIDNKMADKFFSNEKSLSDSFIKSSIELILRQFEWEKIQLFDTDYLSKKISESPDFFTWKIKVNDSLFDILQKMNVKFSNIKLESQNQELRKNIINYSLYSLDKEIISFIIDTPIEDSNFNYKRMKEIPKLAEQLEEDINQLVKILSSNALYNEEESTFLSLLNLKAITSEQIDSLLDIWPRKVTSNEKLNIKIIEQLIKKNKISYSQQNFKNLVLNEKLNDDFLMEYCYTSDVFNIEIESADVELATALLISRQWNYKLLSDVNNLFNPAVYPIAKLSDDQIQFLLNQNYLIEEQNLYQDLFKRNQGFAAKYMGNFLNQILKNESVIKYQLKDLQNLLSHFITEYPLEICNDTCEILKYIAREKYEFNDIKSIINTSVNIEPLYSIIKQDEFPNRAEWKNSYVEWIIENKYENFINAENIDILSWGNINQTMDLLELNIEVKSLHTLMCKLVLDLEWENEDRLKLLNFIIDKEIYVDFSIWNYIDHHTIKVSNSTLNKLVISFESNLKDWLEYVSKNDKNKGRRDLVNQIVEVVISDKENSVSKEIVMLLLKMVSSQKEISSLLLYYFKQGYLLDLEEYSFIMDSLPAPYPKLLSQRGRVTFNRLEENKEFIEYLMERGWISSISDEYIVNLLASLDEENFKKRLDKMK